MYLGYQLCSWSKEGINNNIYINIYIMTNVNGTEIRDICTLVNGTV